ncbi:N-acetyl-gamma-glutamyl-phosphate reductase [Robertkochia flava]|uniref:N-acetyl-gamma-glutamyl-phosphate reductase n=1 Tax=Robertkochia flava TaxID=3447986 RepID=UPI001CCD8E87|nr:N-acetyl-gamma-glutamyl-phosphate reductase [Robertkochia marina]
MIKAGIIGGSGYTAGELLRILAFHPQVEIDFIYSTTNAGKKVSEIHQDLTGTTNLKFSSTVTADADVVFLCLGHGNSTKFLQQNALGENTVIIDLSNDFRLTPDSEFGGRKFVYGLPEFYKEEIQQAVAIANPGCFATAIQLALLPLAKAGVLPEEVHTTGITGSTGAGVQPSATSHFSWRNNNLSWYKPFNHQHLGEIQQNIALTGAKDSKMSQVTFMPYRGDFTRGILTTNYLKFEGSADQARSIFEDAYKHTPYTIVSDEELHLKQVVNTNKCLIHLHKHDNLLLVTSIIDNLVKGASGQAVQNMNLIFGFEETSGLQLKGSYF